MAETILVKDQLTESMTQAGQRLITQLKATALELVGAFWLYDLDRNEWQLTLVTPNVDTEGPREIFSQVLEVLNQEAHKLNGLRLSNVGLLSPDDALPKGLDNLPYLPLMDRRLSRVWFKGAYAEDIYLYFYKDKINFLEVENGNRVFSLRVRHHPQHDPS